MHVSIHWMSKQAVVCMTRLQRRSVLINPRDRSRIPVHLSARSVAVAECRRSPVAFSRLSSSARLRLIVNRSHRRTSVSLIHRKRSRSIVMCATIGRATSLPIMSATRLGMIFSLPGVVSPTPNRGLRFGGRVMITGASQVTNALPGGAHAMNHSSPWTASASIGTKLTIIFTKSFWYGRRSSRSDLNIARSSSARTPPAARNRCASGCDSGNGSTAGSTPPRISESRICSAKLSNR
jgi:hypothetical protein